MALDLPVAVRQFLVDSILEKWSKSDIQSVISALPVAMTEGRVQRLVEGGPFGWMIDARLDKVRGRIALEILEDDRMRGPSHYRVWEDGAQEHLPSEQIGYVLPAGHTAEDESRIREQYFRHNRRVGLLLKRRGFR